MSLQDKINNAKPSSWLMDGIPKWKVKVIIWWAKMKARIRMSKRRKKQLLKLFGVIFGIIMLIVVAISLTGCNYDMIDTVWNYNYAIIQLQNGEVVEGKVEKWRDYEGGQIQVTIDGVIYLTNSYNCTLMYK